MHRFLTAMIGATLGFTACAGGIFAIPLGVASAIEDPGVHNETLLTPSHEELASCVTFSPADSEPQEVNGTQKPGCENGAECLSQSAAQARDNLAAVRDTGGIDVAANGIESADFFAEDGEPDAVARAGPLHGNARESAHVLCKRE